jgi:hypothetical protein
MKWIIPFLLPLTGCDLFGTVRPTGRPVSEAYGGSHDLRILDVESPLRAVKKVPLLSTPEVFAVYSAAHSERDIFFGDRWLYLRLRESQWISERLREADPPATGDAPVESMRPLRDLDWQRVLIPHKQ